MRVSIRRAFSWFGPLVLVAVVAEFAVRLGAPGSRTIYGPIEAILAISPLLVHEELATHLLFTLGRTLGGFAVATIVGVGLGLLLGTNRSARYFGMPLVDLLRPLPSAAVIPVLVLAMGSGETSYLCAIVFGGVWPILLNTAHATGNPDRSMELALRQLDVPRWRSITTIRLAAAAPVIVTGMRVSLSICFILAITAEILIGRQQGIGYLMMLLQTGGNYRGMYACLMVLAITGLIVNQAFSWAEGRLPWIKHQYTMQK